VRTPPGFVLAEELVVSGKAEANRDEQTGAVGNEWLRLALGLPEGKHPFPWQRELLERFLRGAPVQAVDVPTGLGKTAVMAIWLVARALGAPLPRRLVYVVDRRAVVDQATDIAERLREWVATTPSVAAALGLADRSLPISTLRGQHADNRQWLEDPGVPAIVLGTIDMIGSRLLFSGYGVSRKMRPYHAGLLGADALIVLDEAHLVPPFERLIEQIASGVDAAGRPLGPTDPADRAVIPRLHFLSLSATGRERSGDEVVRLNDEDRRHEVVKKRLEATKRLALRDAVDSKDLPEVLATEAWMRSGEGKAPCRIIVFCTSREGAKKVHETLCERAARATAVDVELFVGGRRVYEREAASRWLAARGFLAGTPGRPERATFVIATAAGEVGVDLDADHAVCDLVAWERMVQRFGRVNRRGDGDATIVVVPTAPDQKAEAALAKLEKWLAWARQATDTAHEADDPDAPEPDDHGDTPGDEDEAASGDGDCDAAPGKEPKLKVEERRLAERVLRSDATLKVLRSLRPLKEAAAYDASPAALLELRERATTDADLREAIRLATTPAPLHPPLTRALVEAWSMTSLEEHTGRPEVAPWIRGWPDEDEAPQTTVVWRTFLPVDNGGRLFAPRDLEAFLDAANPHLAERLETETWQVVDWLTKRVKTLKQQEREADETSDRFARPLHRGDVVAVILSASTARPEILRGDALATGDQRDKIERALCGATLMVDRRLGGLASGLLNAAEETPAVDVTEQSDTPTRVVPFRVRRVVGEESGSPEDGWRVEASIPIGYAGEDPTEWLIIESLSRQLAGSEEGRSGSRHAQRLDEHQQWTEGDARRIAEALSLPADLTELLTVAARLHDEGKKAQRWQRAFRAPNGGDPPYAKTVTRPNLALLGGYRHEFGSLPYAEEHTRVAALTPPLRELCLHLIAAHHGYARPLIGTAGAPEPPSRLGQRAREIVLRFSVLEKRWGPWGLAWWEALLRAADALASRRNDQRASHDKGPDGGRRG
jgi:CRISPR-associated endonuclease/helicase Cas3